MKPRNQFWSISDVKKRKRRNRDIPERSQKQSRPEFDSDKFFVGLLVSELWANGCGAAARRIHRRSRIREVLHSPQNIFFYGGTLAARETLSHWDSLTRVIHEKNFDAATHEQGGDQYLGIS